MDYLKLNGITVDCVLGDLPEEREREQQVTVDVALGMDLRPACLSDSIDDTVDYATLIGEIRDALKASRCRLLEHAAEVVAGVCLNGRRSRGDTPYQGALVKSVTVSIRKFGSVAGLGSAEVVIVRSAE